MVVGLLTQSKTSALGNKYVKHFFCLLLWVTLWEWGFGLHYCVVSGPARHINILMMPTTLRVNICPYYHILFQSQVWKLFTDKATVVTWTVTYMEYCQVIRCTRVFWHLSKYWTVSLTVLVLPPADVICPSAAASVTEMRECPSLQLGICQHSDSFSNKEFPTVPDVKDLEH